jgi:Flp pilus assembly protein TadG
MAKTRDERGDAIVQTVIVAPALLLLIMVIIQFALVAHARNVAEAAAQDGVTAARRFDATEADGQARASAALASLGPRMLSERGVSVVKTQTDVTVTVTGTPLTLVPGFGRKIVETSSGPVERYVAPVDDDR